MTEVNLPSRWSLLLRATAGPALIGAIVGSLAALAAPTADVAPRR